MEKEYFWGDKDCIKIDIEKLAKYLPDKDEEGVLINDISEDVLKTYKEWPLLWKFAAMDENQQYFWRNRLLEELAYDEAYILINTLHYCFEKKYNYPYNSFVSVSDYDDNVMFFCNIKWPPQEYRKELAELTEEKLKKRIRYAKQRLGQQVRNGNGELMTIIAYRGSKDVDVQFEDGTVVEHVLYQNFVKGYVEKP